MHFEVQQDRFAAALALAQTVADKRSTMPVLANVLLQAEGDSVVCSATDTMLALTERVPATVKSSGSLTLEVRYLNNLVKTLEPGDVSIKALENHWAHIVSASSEFKLMGMAESDFPSLPDPGKAKFVDVPAHAVIDLIQKTQFSVSTDEARVNLNGALFECDGNSATMVSTDGHRLTKIELELAGPKLAKGVIIPRKGMLELRKVLERCDGSVGLAVVDQHLFARSENLTLSIKLNDVAFPPYRQVIPQEHRREIEIDRTTLLHALRRAEVMAPERTATVRVELSEGKLDLLADNPDLGNAHQSLEVEYSGESLVAGFNARYLLDVLEAIDTERVVMQFQGELDPCVLRPVDGPDYLGVVMPMRI